MREVARYGNQLGKVLEALQVLAAEAELDLPEIDGPVAKITEVKTDAKETLRAEAQAALARLKAVDEDG